MSARDRAGRPRRRYASRPPGCRASRRPPCCSSPSARSAPARSSATSRRPRSRRSRSRSPRRRRSRPRSATTSIDRGGRDRAGRGLHRRGRRRLRPRRARALARRASAPRRSSAAWRPRSSAARSSSCAARRPEQIHVFLRNESPQTIALVVANLHTDARRPGARRCSSPRTRPTSPLRDRDDGRDPAGGRRAGRDRDAAEALERRSPQEYAGRRRRQVARRHPQPRRPHDRAQRARRAGRGRRRARRGGPPAAVHLRGRRQARRPLDPDGAQGGRPEGPRDRPARRLRGRHASGSSRNMSERGAELLQGGDRLPAAAAPRVIEEAQGRIVGDRAPPRGGRRDRHLPRRAAARTS